ncbi:MAG: polyamine aminopropyltransferase [Candidatus Eisenbacteria sp.]|nr:polyamine aminopropyltransferase [Candidatus Eisenbacteria bacterium]
MPEWWYEDPFDSIRQGFRIQRVHEENTRYQHLAVYRHPRLGHILVLDGIVQTTEGDEWVYHETLAQVPINGLVHPPESVLIIGGGDGGTLAQVLKHESVRQATLVEIDERVVAVSRQYLAFASSFSDHRAKLVTGDGAAFVKSAARRHSFDAVLIDSTDPVGPGKVLFETEFYRAVRECLTPGGVMAQQAGIPAHDPRILRMAAGNVWKAFGSLHVFRAPVPTYIGGDMAFVLASSGGRPVDTPKRRFVGRHYNPDVHRASFALPTWWGDLIAGNQDPSGGTIMSEKRREDEIIISVPSKTIHLGHVACPKGCNLIDASVRIGENPSISVLAECGGQKGILYLDPRYGSFENKYTFEIPEGEIIGLSCPHCGTDLGETQEICSLCSAPMFALHLPHGSVLEGCRRKGCVGHRLKIVDLDEQFLRMFKEGMQDSY